MMRRVLVLALVGVLLAAGAPVRASSLPQVRGVEISGTVRTPMGKVLPGIAVRLRSLMTGQLLGRTTSGPGGQFTLGGVRLAAGQYVFEAVDRTGNVVGASSPIALVSTSMLPDDVLIVVNPGRSFRAGVAGAADTNNDDGSFWTSLPAYLLYIGGGVLTYFILHSPSS